MGLWVFFWVRVLDDDLQVFFVGFPFWVLGWRGFCWDVIIYVCGFWDAGDVGRVIEPRVGRLVGPVAVHWQGAAEICPRQRYGFVEMSGKSVSVLGTVAVFRRQICGGQLRTPTFAWLRRSLNPLALFPLPFFEIQPVCNRALS